MVKKNPRILVTGGAGFIGSHLVEALCKHKYEVVVVDNLSHGDKKRIPTGIKLITADITDPQLSKVFQSFKPDVVYHLAAQQDVGTAQKNPIFDANVNILGTLNVLESCRINGVRRIIYADSVAGFGEPEKLPLEADHSRHPISFYGISKHTVEHYLEAYYRYFGISFTGLILANVYGPRQDPLGEGGVVAIFANRMKHNQKVIIHGTGKQTRDFIYVEDVVQAFMTVLYKGKNQFLMAGTGEETSINELFQQMSLISHYKQKPIYGPARSGDVEKSVFKTFDTRQILLWKPKWNLKQGLLSTINLF